MKNKETLEEAAEKYWAKQPYNEDAFIEGAKWQQERMYSEEEVITLLESLVEHPTKPGYKRKDILKVIEQFKRK